MSLIFILLVTLKCAKIIYENRQIQFNSSHATEEWYEHIEVLAANKLLEQKSCPSIYIYNYIVVYCLM